MTPDARVEFENASESIISRLEARSQEMRSVNHVNYREKILNPNYLQAEKFINSL